MKKGSIILYGAVVLMLLAAGFIYFTYVRSDSKPNDDNYQEATLNSPASVVVNNSNLTLAIIDKQTKNPLENSSAYLAGGSLNCITAYLGECSINNFPVGEYSLVVFKKGYFMFVSSIMVNTGDNSIVIELEKKPKEPEAVLIEGRVIKVTVTKSNNSSNTYLKLRDKLGIEYYLFNTAGQNKGFESFINQEVRVKGFKDTGFIGWEHEEAQGIYAEEINRI